MDDIDRAIRKNQHASNQDKPQSAAAQSRVSFWLVGLMLLLACVFLVWVVWSWYASREVRVYYSNIPLAEPTYSKMPKPLVHGEVAGHLEGSRANGKILTFCLVKECDIYKKGSDHFLTGLKKDIKQVTVGSDGTYTQRLLPGTYYMNTRGEGGEVIEGVPVRIDIKAGQIAVWDMQVRTK